jgi:hypothetical protein
MRLDGSLQRQFSIVVIILVPVLFHFAIVETDGVRFSLGANLVGLFRLGLVSVSAASHWAIYSGLLLMFGSSLRPGRTPLITKLARRMNVKTSRELEDYTRKVTIAWCCFFAAQLTISLSLFFLAPLFVWSLFVNILDIPLVITMFAVEYLVRIRCLRDPPRQSLRSVIDMIADVRKSH